MVNETVKQNSMYPACSKCGGEQVFNPRSGKTFCKAKCWLVAQAMPQNPQAQQTQAYKPKQDQTSFKVAYAKDLLIAQINYAAATKNDKFDILAAHQLSVQVIGAMWDVFKE